MPVQHTPATVEESQPLTKEEEMAVRARIEELSKLLKSDGVKATYKIEVRFAEKRSTWQPVTGIVSFWMSGNKLHGGGDDKAYICPGTRVDTKTGEPIPCNTLLDGKESTLSYLTLPEDLRYGGVACSTCGHVWKMEELIGEKVYRLTPQNWATALVRLFVMCHHDADIVLKYSPNDIRSAALAEQERQLKGDLLDPIRRDRKKRGSSIYRLANIFKDTSNGASLYNRFHAFITV